MKFTTVLSVLVFTAAATVSAETNAARLARGLPPLPPARRSSSTHAARGARPSSQPPATTCSTGPVQCCNSVTHSSDKSTGLLASLLGVVLPANVLVGLNCSPLSVIGLGGNSCNAQTVCCSNNNFNGLIALGCSPINLNL